MEELYLTQVDISFTVPNNVANLTSLTSLEIEECGLHGEFPAGSFQLPNLQILSVQLNSDLTGCLPEFNRCRPLKLLKLAGTSFYGELLDSIGDLKLLYDFDVRECNFSGPVPSSFGNLTELIICTFHVTISTAVLWIGLESKLNSISWA